VSTYKLHPLHTVEFIAEQLRCNGSFDTERCTGRTTAQALKALAHAIESPGVEIPLRDHHDSTGAHANLRDAVRRIADALGLEHIYTHVRGSRIPTVVFEKRQGTASVPPVSAGNSPAELLMPRAPAPCGCSFGVCTCKRSL